MRGVGKDSESESDWAPSPLELGELPGLSTTPTPLRTLHFGGSAANVINPSLSSWNVTSITPKLNKCIRFTFDKGTSSRFDI